MQKNSKTIQKQKFHFRLGENQCEPVFLVTDSDYYQLSQSLNRGERSVLEMDSISQAGFKSTFILDLLKV